MRIADKMAYEQVNANIGKNRSTMSDLQTQASTQKRVTKPSDDPLAAARVLGHRVDLSNNKQFSKSLTYARSFIEYTDQSLGELTDTLVRAKELAIQQANDASAGPQTRKAVATEINQLYRQIVQIGNRKLGDRFIFGGFKTQASPFDFNGDYHGDTGEMMIHVDKDSFLAMNTPGSHIFLGGNFSENGPIGLDPIQAKTIEEWNQQKVDEQHGQQPGPMPQQQQPINSRGPASVQAPTTVPTGPDAVQTSVKVDSGGEANNGGVNLFRIMTDFETSLHTNDKGGVQQAIDELDQAISQVVLSRAQVGSRAATLDNYMTTKEKEKVEDQIAISSLEDADIYSTVSDINKTESTLQATLQTSGKLLQKSLMDFIR